MPSRRIIQLLLRILGITTPPDVNDKDALRAWLVQLARIALNAASVTQSDVDDNIATIFLELLEDGEAWNALYSLIMSVVAGKEVKPVLAASPFSGNNYGIDVATIMAIVHLIVEIINTFKN